MVEFLVEAYFSCDDLQIEGCAERIAETAEALTREGHPVRLVRVVLVPEDETSFFLFEADSPETVQEVAARSGLRFERFGAAVSAWTPPLPSSHLPSSHRTIEPTNQGVPK